MISLGFGAASDHNEAVHWFQKTADKGHSAAQFRLGELIVKGHVVGKGSDEGMEWLKKAAAQNHDDAITLLGSLQ